MRQKHGPGFSLLEVVAAIGLLAAILIMVFGLMASGTRTDERAADVRAITRLGETIPEELGRLKGGLGLNELAACIPAGNSSTPLRLTGTRDGGRVLCMDGPAAAADHALNDPIQPGIACRERYFLIEITRQPDLPYAPDAGFLAVSARVSWPYRLPEGPASADATTVEADPARETTAAERSSIVLNFALRP